MDNIIVDCFLAHSVQCISSQLSNSPSII